MIVVASDFLFHSQKSVLVKEDNENVQNEISQKNDIEYFLEATAHEESCYHNIGEIFNKNTFHHKSEGVYQHESRETSKCSNAATKLRHRSYK